MKRFLIFCSLFLLTAAISLAGMKVKTERWEGAELSAYQSYSWRTGHDADSGHPLAEGSRLSARLQEIGDELLAEHGLGRSLDEESDLWVRCTGVAEEMLQIEGTERDLGGISWVGDPHAHSMVSYRRGTLLVEIVDAESEKVIWAGWATDVVPSLPDPEKVGKKAEKAMRKILKQLPRG
jgi:hypothetical protein